MAAFQDGIPVAEIVSALSFALDLTEDSVPGHSLRTCLLSMRLGAALGLDDALRTDLFYASMLKDIGCSTNAGRLSQIIGSDERSLKRAARFEDWTRPSLARLRMVWRHVAPERSRLSRFTRMTRIALRQKKDNEEMFQLRCERGAGIVRCIGLSENTALAVRHVDEHWQGSGFPDHIVGESIPVLSRVLRVAQHLDVFATGRSRQMAMDVLSERSGRSFDPALVQLAHHLHRDGSLWKNMENEAVRASVLDLEPGQRLHASEAEVDAICNGFAEVVDVKSSFTGLHSRHVTSAAVQMAEAMGLSPERRRLISQASLLHDLGKLRVPNSILDKPGRLSETELQVVYEHPGLTHRILSRVEQFQELATIAGQHHEKLDGSGYPGKLSAKDLSLEARLIAVADVYAALAEDRPYRPGLRMPEIRRILDQEAGIRLDRACYDALLSTLN